MTPEAAAQNRQRIVTLMSHGGICHLCGDGGATEIDLVIPIEGGGTTDPSNLAPICDRCIG